MHVEGFDYGKPITGLSPKIQVWRNDKLLNTNLTASESITSPSEIRLSSDPGYYQATYILPSSSSYSFTTRIEFSGREGNIIKTAETFMEVGSEQVSLRRLEVRPILEQGGCVKKLTSYWNYLLKHQALTFYHYF